MILKVKKIIVSFLTNKKHCVSINGFFSPTKTVPQASTLGSLHFLIYINDLKNDLDKYIVIHFEDDYKTTTRGRVT